MTFCNGKQEEGVALVIVFFIMVVVVAVVLSTATYLYTDIKVIRDMSNSVVSFYAADSGVEKVLYYDRKELQGTVPNQVRGVCDMCHGGNGGGGSCSDFSSDPSLECACSIPVAGTTDPIHGCDPGVCDDCTVSFTTTLNNWGVTYAVKATVYPHQTPYDMEIDSTGAYGGVGRALDITLNPNQ